MSLCFRLGDKMSEIDPIGIQAPKIPKQHTDRLELEQLSLKTTLNESKERHDHLLEVDNWRKWATNEIYHLQRRTRDLIQEIKELRDAK